MDGKITAPHAGQYAILYSSGETKMIHLEKGEEYEIKGVVNVAEIDRDE